MNGRDNRLYKDNSYKLRFYGGKNYAFININPDFIKQLGLTESDDISQQLTDDGRIAIGRKMK